MRTIPASFPLAVVTVVLATPLRAQQYYPIDFIVMPVTQTVKQNTASPEGAVTSQAYNMKGIEAFLTGAKSGFGVGVRHITGPALFTERAAKNTDAYILIGDKTFHLDAAYSIRNHGALDTTYQFARAGFSTTVYLGTSGIALRGRAGYYIPFKKHEQSKLDGPEGWEGETSISYTYPKFPVFAQLGYRIERFTARGWEEEVSAVTLGAGIWMWGR